MNIKRAIKKLIIGFRCDSETFTDHYRKLGAHIGERVFVFQPFHTCFDDTRPYLISIGNDVQITRGVTILTHGYDWSVLKGEYGEVLGSAGKVTIGNNVFIGMNATILKGVTIGNNVIIGANSLVNTDIPDGTVWGGNPAKQICTVSEYYAKRKSKQISEAKELYDAYVEQMGKEPEESEFSEFFWLFQPRNKELIPAFKKQMKNVGNYEYSMEQFKKSTPEFEDYQHFLKALKEMKQ